MIPLRDTVPSTSFPGVTYLLIALNVGVFLLEVSLGSSHAQERFVMQNGFVPARLLYDLRQGVPFTTTFAPVLSSMFLHGGWMHLVGNMLYLFIFGDNVEDRLGHARYLGLYLASGIVAALAQFAGNPASTLPMVGASGAIAGVTGAYLRFYPTARVVTLVPVFFILTTIRVPAFLVLIPWFLMQIQGGLASLGGHGPPGGVAFWAHVGGFVLGLLVGPILSRSPPRRAHSWQDESYF
jgi:membrane associated rhomboid family serine protease